MPTYDPEERVFVYGILGGAPRYLSPLDPSQDLGTNITRLLYDPTFEFALFSRSGFKRSVEEAVTERDDLRLFDLTDIVAALEQLSS